MILRPGTFLQNRYEILARIGSGGMSDVYKAKCHKLNRYVAIKVLKVEFSEDAGFVSKFKMEAQAAAGLSHPNIVNVYDVNDEDGLHYIVMELIEGVTLKNYINNRGQLDIREAVGISIQVALGIQAAHERHIIHRDIKPQNIIISTEGKVKVADFGIARAVSSETLTSTAMGSVHYISPEQAKGGHSDERSDIYSLGVSLYEMITGEVPFKGDTTVAVALAHLEQSPKPPSVFIPDIPPEIEKIILRCIQKKPERRYQSINELIIALRKCLVMISKSLESSDEDRDIDSDTQIFSVDDMLLINNSARKANLSDPPLHKGRRNNKEKIYAEEDVYSEKEEKVGLDRFMGVAGILVAILLVIFLIFIIFMLNRAFNKRSDIKPTSPIVVESSTQSDGDEDSTKKVEVPDVTGMDQDLADEKLKEALLQMKVKDSVYDEEVPKGGIISQEPEAGEEISKYSKIEVIVSLGSDTVDISNLNLMNLSKDTAKTELEGLGLLVTVEEEFNEDIEEGKMIKYEPQKPKRGSKITLYYSKGKEIVKVNMPELVGKSEKDAAQELTNLNLVGDIKKDYSSSVAKGVVMSQSIEANTPLDEGSTVSFFVSLGPVPETTKAYKYIASIDSTYNVSDLIGPGSATTSVNIMVRLRQNVNGEARYTTLMEPRKVKGDTLLPVRFKTIEGAYGVDQGFVEVVVIQGEELSVLKTYTVEFFKVE